MKNFTLFLTTILMTFISFYAWSLEIPPKTLEKKSMEEQPNILINGDFSNGLNSWSSFIADFAGVSAAVAVTDGEAAITNIAGAGGEVWFVQLNQLLTPAQIGALQVGQTYKASFQARSSVAGRQLRMYFGEDGGGFTAINISDFSLNTTMETFEASFTVGATFGAMKFGFEMGLSNNPVFIDNVSLVRTTGTSTEPPTGGGGLNLPVTFDDPAITYTVLDFGGNQSEIVTDPTDPSNKVVRSVKTADAQLWAGTTVGGAAGFTSRIPFAAGATTMSVRVWSPVAGIPVRIKVEASNDPTISVETDARVTQAQTWQTLVFDFSNEAFGTSALNFERNYNMASIFFDFGTSGAEAGGARTYFWDDMKFGGSVGENTGSILLPITFENAIDWSTVISNFDGGELTVIDNPDTNGNASVKVGRMVKNVGQPWGGAFIALDQTIDLSKGTEFKASVWAPRANSKMLLKFENPLNPAQAFEQEVTIPEANQWVDVSFDMSGANRAFTFRNVVLIFDMGTVGDGSANFTWFVDNIRQIEINTGDGSNKPALPLTFEEDITWEAVITNFDGGELSVITNPDANGNPSAKVARMVKNAGQPWGGAFIDLAGPIDLAKGTEFTAQVWAPRANTTMLFKFENSANTAQNFEQSVTIPAANQWTDVTINMSGANRTFSYDRVVVIFDLGTPGDGSANFTWFVDNIKQVQSEGPGVGTLLLPVTFDDESLDYALTDFGGNESAIVTDPTNPLNKVVQSTKTVDAQLWAGTTVGGTVGFASPIPFAAGATFMNVRVWSPVAGIPVRLKVEAANDPTISVETEATVTRASGWQTLTFNFVNQATGTEAINFARSYNKASIFFDFGRTGAEAGGARTYFWDDLAFGQGTDTPDEPTNPSDGISFPITFEQDIDWAASITNFDGGELTVINNPDTNGNPSAKVGRMVKNAGQPWGGAFITLTDKIDFSKGDEFTVSVWAPRANSRLLFKIENEENAAMAFEQSAVIPTANGWVDVKFNMSGANKSLDYQKVIIIFDLGDMGDGSPNFTWFVDNFRQGIREGSGGTNNLTLPITFEQDIDWGGVITNFDGGELTVINNPDTNGNSSAKVGRMVKNAGQPWGGSFFTLSENLDLSKGTEFIVSVWAPRANSKLLFKIENQEIGAQNFEQEVTIPTANQWVDVKFNLAGANRTFTYQRIVLIFDLGTMGDGSANFTWFVDNIRQVENEGGGGSSSLELPVTFDDGSIDYGLTDFGGNASEIVADPTNPNNRVVSTIKTGFAELWAGTTVGGTTGFASPIPFKVDATTMSLRVWSPVANIPVRIKVEDATNPDISVETEAMVTASSTWQTLVFDFSKEATGTTKINLANTYNKASVFFNFGVTGADTGARTYFWDDMKFGGTADPGEPNNGPVLPLTFEQDIDWTASITNFDGGELTIINNPDTNGNPSSKVARMVKNAGQPWGGAYITLAQNIDLSRDREFSVLVWAPRANTKMLFKIENENNSEQAFEVEQTIAEANKWVEVKFDMNNANRSFSYKKLIMIFELGQMGDGSTNFTWFVDNIRQLEGAGGNDTSLNLPVTFDNVNINYALTDFGGTFSEIIADPTNSANKVVRTIKTGAAETWAGTTIGGTSGFVNAIPFTATETSMTLRVWSPSAGIPVRIKVEDSRNGEISVETEAMTTEAQTWQTLTFNFANQATGTAALNLANRYNKASVFFDFGRSGAQAGEKIYFWDDMVFVTAVDPETPATKPLLPLTFEQDIDWTASITNFDGGELTIINNPDINGNPSAKVARMVKNAGQPWGGAFIDLGERIDFSKGTEFKAQVWAPRANTTMLFKIENSAIPAQSFEQSVTIPTANTWTEITINMSGANIAFPYDRVVLIFDLGTVGDGSANFTWFIDNIRQIGDGSNLALQSITFPEIPTQTIGAAPVTLNATASSGLMVSYTTENQNITITGNTVTLVNPGRATIVANQAGNDEFRPAAPVSISFCINPAKPTITMTGEGTGTIVLTSSALDGNQWFRNGIAIEGATGRTFNATAQGSYSVSVNIDGCVSQVSDSINLIVNSFRNQQPRELSVFPNPVENYLQIRGLSGPVRSIEMIDMTGRITNVVFEEATDGIRANVSQLNPGMYIVRIQETNRSYSVKVMKK